MTCSHRACRLTLLCRRCRLRRLPCRHCPPAAHRTSFGCRRDRHRMRAERRTMRNGLSQSLWYTQRVIVVVDAGFGNLRSVEKALAQVGLAPKLTHDPDEIRRADKVVLPGQGAFKDCMRALGGGLDEV